MGYIRKKMEKIRWLFYVPMTHLAAGMHTQVGNPKNGRNFTPKNGILCGSMRI